MQLEGLSFVKLLTQRIHLYLNNTRNITKSPGDHANLRALIFQNHTSFPHAFYLWNEVRDL